MKPTRLILVPLLIISSCATYGIRSGYGGKAPTCEPYYGSFETEKECLESEMFKVAAKASEDEKYYRIYKRGYTFFNEETFYCGSEGSGDYRNKPYGTPITETKFNSKDDCEKSDELKKAIKEFKTKIANDSKRMEQKRIAKIDEQIKANPSYSAYRDNAVKKQISIGMPEELVYLSWGRPQRSNDTTGSYGTHKQLVYGMSTYVYIQNGKVTSWQNSK